MTQNQIKWSEVLENRRHNLKSERLTSDSIAEAKRHDVETEGINWFTAKSSREVGMSQAGASYASAAASAAHAAAAAESAKAAKKQADVAEYTAQKLYGTDNPTKKGYSGELMTAQTQKEKKTALKYQTEADLNLAKKYGIDTNNIIGPFSQGLTDGLKIAGAAK